MFDVIHKVVVIFDCDYDDEKDEVNGYNGHEDDDDNDDDDYVDDDEENTDDDDD